MPKGSFQVFTDANTKIIQGYGGGNPQDSQRKHVVTEKIENIMGSSAGAGSGEFHMYLNARKRERTRLDDLEVAKSEAELQSQFRDKVARNHSEAIARTQHNAMKRLKEKEKKALRKQKYNAETEKSKNCDETISEIIDEVASVDAQPIRDCKSAVEANESHVILDSI